MDLELDKKLDEIPESDALSEILQNTKGENVRIFLKEANQEKFSIITILNEEILWEWVYWVVKKIECYVWWNQDVTRYFAIKEFKENDRDYIGHSIGVYTQLKKFGISTRNVYRRWYENNSILMSLWNIWNKRMISSGQNSDTDEVENLWLDQLNFDEMSERVYRDIYVASNNDIKVECDAYFILYDSGTESFQHIIWDFDLIELEYTSSPKSGPNPDLLVNNLDCYLDWIKDLRKKHKKIAQKLLTSFIGVAKNHWFIVRDENRFPSVRRG